jgi:2',3'-cyclic-nucleotide 2'-phosphodiesterase (5'-nucleotidase family)
VVVSIKNGGGIRAAIGEIVSTGTDRYEERPPLANPISGKMEGEVSQLDIENSLRFNNGLTLFTLTAEQLIEVLEHGVSATEPGATPGQFPQVGGVKFHFDPANEPYSRLTKAWLVDMNGQMLDMLFENGEIVGNPERPVRCVALNFLVNNGGDNYPFPEFEAENPTFFNKIDLVNQNRSGNATFANDGSEQDALAEYLNANFSMKENAYRKLKEGRIVNLQEKTMLHLLHHSDAEGSSDVLETAPNFAALVDEFVRQGNELGVTTIQLASGDNYIPSPFFSASGDRSMREIFRDATGNPMAREGEGYADIRIHNILGIDASALGNHEFDLGTNTLGGLMRGDIRSATEARFIGTAFPYLSANLDFSGDGNLAGLYTDEIIPNTLFATSLSNLANPADKKIAPGDYYQQERRAIWRNRRYNNFPRANFFSWRGESKRRNPQQRRYDESCRSSSALHRQDAQ